MPDPDIYAVADRFKRALIVRESAATRQIRRYYRGVERRIGKRLGKLTDEIAAWYHDHPDEKLPEWWLFEHKRLQMLQQQVEAELARFAEQATGRIEREQRRLIQRAERAPETLARVGLGPPPPGVAVTWARLPRQAVEQLVGTLQDGSPLRDLLDTLGPAASGLIRHELVTGLALGENPRVVARRCQEVLAGGRKRAELIARTEMLRSYRESSLQGYRANGDVLKGWVWHSARDTRTCVMCWAMHGTEHSLDERLDDHPRGRCSLVPKVKTWAELGFAGVPETRAEIEPGASLFAKLSEEQQRKILGNAGYEAYKAGAVRLADFAGQRHDQRWGSMRYARSLKEILGAEEARKWYEVGVQARREATRNVPRAPLKMPNSRHKLEKVMPRSLAKPTNTVVESWDTVRQDLAAINQGKGERQEGRWVINGRTYGVEKGGRGYPISGPGFHVLDRVAYKALGMYNKYGLTSEAERMLDRWDCPQEARRVARAAYEAVKR